LTIGPLTLPSPRWGEGRVRGDTIGRNEVYCVSIKYSGDNDLESEELIERAIKKDLDD
jgi:hypothetical protein